MKQNKSIDDFENVINHGEIGNKYVILEIIDSQGNSKPIFRAHENCKFHKQILRWVSSTELDYPGISYIISGGRYIRFNHDKKLINIYSSSVDYGMEMDRNLTKELLEQKYPDYTVEIGWP